MSTRDRILELATEFRSALLLQQAVAIGLIARLERPAHASIIAREMGWRAGKLQVVLEALAELGLAAECAGRWGLTSEAERLLLRASPSSVDAMVLHEWRQQPLWQDLDAVLAAGDALPGQQDVTQRRDPDRAATLLRAMRGYHRSLVARVADLDVWRGCSHVVDLAGGHGSFMSALLRTWPQLRGTVADLPSARAVALETLEADGLATRATFLPVDLEDPRSLMALACDGVLFARALHNFGPREIEAALSAIARVLPPAGVVVIVERHLGAGAGVDAAAERENAVFAAYMAINCRAGWVPPTPWLRAALRRAGLVLRHEILIEQHMIMIASVSGVCDDR